jgi:4-methylaminobutanoate oxidase (formaldehyde-forming)
MEKGYRDYGHDMDNTDNPYEVGLGFTVKLDKPADFIGKSACAEKQAQGVPTRRLAQVLVKDPQPLLFHAEVVHRNGRPAGYVRSGSYGYTLGGAVGLFMIEADQPVDQDYIDAGEWDIDIAGTRYPAAVSLKPMYDPDMARIKA